MAKTRKCPHCPKNVPIGRAGGIHIGKCGTKKTRRAQKLDAARKVIRRSLSNTSQRQKSAVQRTDSWIERQIFGSDSTMDEMKDAQDQETPQAATLVPRHHERAPSEVSDGDTEVLPQSPHDLDATREMSPLENRRSRPAYKDVLPLSGALEAAEGYDDNSVPWRTKLDAFGLYRIYRNGKPSYTPDAAFTLLHQSDVPTIEHEIVQFNASAPQEDETDNEEADGGSEEVQGGTQDNGKPAEQSWLGEGIFANATIALVMKWFYDGQSVISSKQRMNDFIKNVILHPDFRAEDLEGFRMELGMQALDNHDKKRIEDSDKTPFPIRDNWRSRTLYLAAACPGHPQRKPDDQKWFPLKNFMYRRLMDVILAAFREPAAEYFHLTPFEEYYKPARFGATPERQYGELYTSESFLEAHEEVRRLADADGCTHEVVVAGLMLGSDGTLLSNFGTQSLWPVYLCLGNLSKYVRANSSSFAMHHLAYIPKLPDNINDWWLENFGESPGDAALSHMRCELFQAVWLLMMDEDLMHAYVHGYDTDDFIDRVMRRVFPRFFTYATDYLEKILAVCVKNLSTCPCPRCLVSKSRIDQLGTPDDMDIRTKFARKDDKATHSTIKAARDMIYKKGKAFSNDAIAKKLGPKSLRPTQNAFSVRLSEYGFNSYDFVAPDGLHEFEIGVWQSTLTHLLRILQCLGKLSDLDARYRSFPTFGRGIIRKFRDNVSAMIKFAARDFEDVLQCAIAAFENLIPEPHGQLVRRLLFELATWHALAKLRRHSDLSTTDLEASTVRLGQLLREFRDTTCVIYHTVDLPAHQSNRSKKARKSTKKREFNLSTYKLHSLGHYVRYIRNKGTTDSYSSGNNESEHVRSKRHRWRAPKAKEKLLGGIAKQQRREHQMWEISEKHARKSRMQKQTKRKVKSNALFDVPSNEYLPPTAPQVHHAMSQKVRREDQINMLRFMKENQADPALKNFARNLKHHLLLRLLGRPFNSDEDYISDDQLDQVVIINDLLYRHKTLRINYTAYDLRREQDSINPRKFAAVMLLSNEDYDPASPNHPYWYCQVLGVFHVHVIHRGPLSSSTEIRSMEFLWVRWLALEKDWQFGFQAKHLPRVGFVNEATDGTAAFGFVDPAHVVRAIHAIPDEDSGRSDNGLGPSIVRNGSKDNLDWNTFWVNFFVDRDMFMRYRGGAAGHAAVRDAVDEFLSDRDHVDREHYRKREEQLEGPQYHAQPPQAENESTNLQDKRDREGWSNNFGDGMDEDEDEDYGYTRREEGVLSDSDLEYVDDDESDDE